MEGAVNRKIVLHYIALDYQLAGDLFRLKSCMQEGPSREDGKSRRATAKNCFAVIDVGFERSA
jgi:hypothetical protein